MAIFIHDSIYVLLGIFAGTLSGLLGVGGGIIVVPAFIFLFGAYHFPSASIMHCAAGTSLASMIVTLLFSAYAHYRRGAKYSSVLSYMIPGLIIGTAAGSIAAFFIHSLVLEILFGLLLLCVSFKEFLLTYRQKLVIKTWPLPSWMLMLSAAFIGTLSGFLGVGGGTLTVPFLQRVGLDIRAAVSNSTLTGLVVAVTGTICFILIGYHQADLPARSVGFVYLPAAIGVSLTSPIFAFFGAYLHHHMKVIVLKRMFSVFLFIVGIKLLV